MARKKKKFIRNLKRHLRFNKHAYLGVFLVFVLIVGAMWSALTLMTKERQHLEDVAVLSGTPETKYLAALEQAAEGDLDEARVTMLRLARLGDTAENPLGFGKAHLWVAKDKLGAFDHQFIQGFPEGADFAEKGRVTLPGDPDTIALIERHLQHAVALNPELIEAPLLLAAIYAAQGKRNESVNILMNAITNEVFPHPELHVPLANVLTMPGEDLALEENAWHLFSTLGQTLRQSRGIKVPVRVRYVINAILLKKLGSAEAAIRRMEAQFPVHRMDEADMDSFIAKRKQIRLLRMAFHYHQALGHLSDKKPGGEEHYKLAIDEMEKALKAQPENQAVVKGLAWISEQSPKMRVRVGEIIKEGLLNKESNKMAKANSSLAFALSLEPGDPSRKKYLKEALKDNPKNPRALMALANQLLMDAEPDYDEVEKLAKNALKYCEPESRHALYRTLGLAQLKQGKWQNTVVSLEKSLGGIKNKAEVHGWLAEAYQELGQPKLADTHRALADK